MKRILLPLLILVQITCLAQDIVITEVKGPMSCPQFTRFPQQIAIKNQGIVDVPNTFGVAIFLSQDSILEIGKDAYVAGFSVYGMTAGSSAVYSPEISDIVRISGGDYYEIIQIDANLNIQETDKKNNRLIIPHFQVAWSDYNFKIENLSFDKTDIIQNDVIIPKFDLSNLGQMPIDDDIEITFVLTKNRHLESPADETTIGHASLSMIDGKFKYDSINSGVYIPNTQSGTYNIFAIVNVIAQYHLTDKNSTFTSVIVKKNDVDLEIPAIRNVAVIGREITVECTLRNNGTTGVAKTFIDASLISNDGTVYAASFIYGNYTKYVKAGESKTLQLTISRDLFNPVPADGTYALELSVNDSYGNHPINETNYKNNRTTATDSIRLSPVLPGINLIGFGSKDLYNTSDKTFAFVVQFQRTGDLGYNVGYVLTITNSDNVEIYSKNFAPDLGSIGEIITSTQYVYLQKGLPEGRYKIEVKCMEGRCDTTPSSKSIYIDITAPTQLLTGIVQGQDGSSLTHGVVYLYKKSVDGQVVFIGDTLLTSNNFGFYVENEHAYTLYYVPDPAIEKEFAPTIFGETVTLSNDSFFVPGESLTFKIIKMEPLPDGPGVISGTITTTSQDNPSGRRGVGVLSFERSIPPIVLLLSSEGKVVRYTYADDKGYYEFKNLPRKQYEVLVPQAPDKQQASASQDVDITNSNLETDFWISPSGVSSQTLILLLKQLIQFNKLPDIYYGNDPIQLSATSDSGLPVSYISDNTDVVEINKGSIVIKGAGSATVTAEQAGDQFFGAALPVPQIIVVNKGEQHITFAEIATKEITDEKFDLSGSASSLLDVVFHSDNESVATIEGHTVTILNAGVTHITATQAGDHNYNAALPVTRTLSVNITTGIEDSASLLTVYPNPTDGFIWVDGDTGIKEINILNSIGQLEPRVSLQDNQVDLTGLAPGIYMLKIQLASTTKFLKIVKR